MRLQTAHLLLLSTLLVLGCVVAEDDPRFVCPKPETISPCVCKKACSWCFAVIFCGDFTAQGEFEEAMKKIDYPFRYATISNSVLQYIPVDFIEEKQVGHLDVSNCTFSTLLDRNLEKDTPLNVLDLKNLKLISGLRYDVFSSMNHLVALRIQDMDVMKIPSNFCTFMPPKLKTLHFNNTKTAKIGDSAFASCRALKALSIDNGIIKTVKTSMFPKNLEYLWLQGNKIKSLPNDLAVGLPNLISIRIDGNQFSSLDENIFGEIPGLKYLYVDENPLVCDCKLHWILGRKNLMILGTCPNLDNRRIMDLTEEDFKIC